MGLVDSDVVVDSSRFDASIVDGAQLVTGCIDMHNIAGGACVT